MKSENNNSFTISPTNGGDQEYIIFNKVKEKEPSEDRLIKGSGYWGMYNILNYQTVKIHLTTLFSSQNHKTH